MDGDERRVSMGVKRHTPSEPAWPESPGDSLSGVSIQLSWNSSKVSGPGTESRAPLAWSAYSYPKPVTTKALFAKSK
jgi:hypothetical protein